MLFQPPAQRRVAAVHLVADGPAQLGVGLVETAGHRYRQRWLRREADVRRYSGVLAPRPVVDPGGGKVQLAVDKCVSFRRHVDSEHAQLAVLDPPGRTAILTLNPGGPFSFLDESGLVEDQNPVGLAELLQNIGTNEIP